MLFHKIKIINYLAHAYLSFHQPGILVGNMVSDFVKGKKQFDFPKDIQQGISLHRQIDSFTDNHRATKEAAKVFHPYYRLYSGAFVDVVYDHFLANDKAAFSQEDLFTFSQTVYETLHCYATVFPPAFGTLFPYMEQQNWLYNYRSVEGTIKSFGGLVRRATYLHESDKAAFLFHQHYELFQELYQVFWKAVEPFALQTMNRLIDSTA